MSIYDGVHIFRDPRIFSGRPIIEHHRVTVHDVAVLHREGQSAESIAEDYELTLAEVNAALAYYRDHELRIERELIEDQEITSHLEGLDRSVQAQRLRAARKERAGRTRLG